MRRGDLYRVAYLSRTDPKRSRVFVVVNRQVLCDTAEFSAVICAPISSSRHGLATQVPIGEAEGLGHTSAIHCDGLVSLPRSALIDYVGSVGPQKLAALHVVVKVALDLLD